MYLLDTMVVSELRKPERTADTNVRAWVDSLHAHDLFVSVITILEIRVGIGRLRRRDADQADRLDGWLDDTVLPVFGERILPLTTDVARRTADLHVPDPRPAHDALIAGTALAHGLSVATRNTTGFAPMSVEFVDPWLAPH